MATRVTITKALEAKLRKGEGLADVIELLDDEQRKREAAQSTKSKEGLGYKELVSLLRSYLGDSLLTPPKPNTAYIVRIINKTKEQGLDYTNVEQILLGLRRCMGGTGPYRLGDIVYNADKYYARGLDDGGSTGAGTDSTGSGSEFELRNSSGGGKSSGPVLYTGRPPEGDD